MISVEYEQITFAVGAQPRCLAEHLGVAADGLPLFLLTHLKHKLRGNPVTHNSDWIKVAQDVEFPVLPLFKNCATTTLSPLPAARTARPNAAVVFPLPLPQ